jgi:hypothetical protein
MIAVIGSVAMGLFSAVMFWAAANLDRRARRAGAQAISLTFPCRRRRPTHTLSTP